MSWAADVVCMHRTEQANAFYEQLTIHLNELQQVNHVALTAHLQDSWHPTCRNSWQLNPPRSLQLTSMDK